MTRNVMLTEDYLIRQINIILANLGRILGFKTAYMFIEAQIAVNDALQELFNIPADIVRQLDDQALLDTLTYLDVVNTDKLQLAADIFKEEGDLYAMRGQTGDSTTSYQRALNFYLDAVLNGGAWNLDDPAEKIEECLEKLADQQLDPDTYYGLYLYAEQRGQYPRAILLLDHLATYPELEEEIQQQRRDLLETLSGLEPEALEEGGLSPAELETLQARWVFLA
jgi:hypothetical protein